MRTILFVSMVIAASMPVRLRADTPRLNEWLIRGQAGPTGDCMSEYRLGWGCEPAPAPLNTKCRYFTSYDSKPPELDDCDVKSRQRCYAGDPNCNAPLPDGTYDQQACHFRVGICFCVEHNGIPCTSVTRPRWCEGPTAMCDAGNGTQQPCASQSYRMKFYAKNPTYLLKGVCSDGSRGCTPSRPCDAPATCSYWQLDATDRLETALTGSRAETGLPGFAPKTYYDLGDCTPSSDAKHANDYLTVDFGDDLYSPGAHPHCGRTKRFSSMTDFSRPSSRNPTDTTYRSQYPRFACVGDTPILNQALHGCPSSLSSCPASGDDFDATRSSTGLFYFADRAGCTDMQTIDVPLNGDDRVKFVLKDYFWPNGEHVNGQKIDYVDRNGESLTLVCCDPTKVGPTGCR